MFVLPPRYEQRRLLGEGGMGRVYQVLDRERGADVALKVFSPAAGSDLTEGRFLFKQEFWAMASLSHPSLIGAFDYGELADGTPFLTMELVPGADLAAGPEPATEASVRAWLPGLASALSYLHGRGYVHGDLKPDNVRLVEGGQVKLMDLGLLERSGRVGGPIRGSLLYVAPEVARQGAVDARSDLYALGAVLYHALAGQPPFDDAAGPIALLRAHLTDPPAPLRSLAPGISRELEGAVMRLLAKEPAERFGSANELLAALGLATDDHDVASLLTSPLVGREAVQAEIATLLAGSQGGTLSLVGGAGAGKSRLLAESRAASQLAGLSTFYAQGLGVDATPYQALLPWLSALTASPSDARERLAPVLARLLPGLAAQPAPVLEGAQERMRLHGAVAELAAAVAPSATWLLDDLDTLDGPSRELITFLQSQAASRSCTWRWVLASCDAVEGTRMLPLAPLADAEVLTIAAAMLSQAELPAPVVERLPILSGGMPGAIEAILGHWTRTDTLVRDGGRWVAGEDAAFDLPGGLEVVLDARFARLGERPQLVGRLAALLGAMAELPWLAALSSLDEAAFFHAVAELEAADVIARDDSHYRFVRPVQAAALAATWGPEEARRLHTVAASTIATDLDAPADSPALPLGAVMAVARHHLAGETPAEAVSWVLAAAKRTLAMYVSTGLDVLLRRTLELSDVDPGDRLGLNILLGTVLRFTGGIDEALALYEQAILPAAREQAEADLAHHLVTYGIIHQMKGRYPQALKAMAEAINLSDAAGDLLAGVRARVFAGRVAFFSGETGAAKTHLASAVRRAREAGLREFLAGSLSLYGYVLATTDGGKVTEGLAMLDESIRLNRQLGNLYELHEALNNQGNVFMAAGRLIDAQAVFSECLALCQRMGMANEALFAHLNLAAVLVELGDLAGCLGHARRAVEMARVQGRKFPEGFASAVEGLALVYSGELGTGLERLERGLGLAREIKNRYLELSIMVARLEALVHLGRFADARLALDKARELAEDTHNDEQNAKLERFDCALTVATWSADAAERLAEVLERARASGHHTSLAYALRWQADRLLRQHELPISLNLLAEALELAQAAGLCLLQAEIEELWGRALMSSDPAAALAHFEAGLTRAQASGYRLMEILCQAGMGALDPARRLDRQEAPRRLDALMASLDEPERQDFLMWPERAAARDSMRMEHGGFSTDRVHHLTDLIASISAQSELGDIMAQALEALVEIAEAERGFLLLYKGFEVSEQIFYGMNPDDSDAYSSSLAYQILWSGEPLFIEDAQSHTNFADRASVQNLALRSVVGVPLHDGHEILGVMLADSQRINTRFTPEDLDLALALGRQVAITIANQRRLERYKNGYEELTVLHRLAMAMVGARSLDELMAPVAVEAIATCDADRAVLLVGESAGLVPLTAFDKDGRPLSVAGLDFSQSVSSWVYEHGEPLHLVDAQSEEAFQARRSILTLGLRTIYAVPVAHEGRRLGVLYLDHTRMGEANPTGLHTLARMGELIGAYLARQGS